jgi:DNA-directed RNA polymerase specialized sigma24 family protein
MALLSTRLELFDVPDVEELTGRIVHFSGLTLSHIEREELHTYLIETCWILSTRYRPDEGIKFSTWAGRTLRLRCIDWVRSHRGRTRWTWTDGSYERPRVQLVSLDTGPDGSSLVDTLEQVDGDPQADSSSDLRRLLADRGESRSRDLDEIGLDAPRPAP